MQAEPHPDRQEYPEAEPLHRAGYDDLRVSLHQREHGEEKAEIALFRLVLAAGFALIHDEGQQDRDDQHEAGRDIVDGPPAQRLRHDPGPCPRDQNAADHAGRQHRRHRPEARRVDPFGGIGRQQVRRDGEEAENGRGEREQPEVLREGHARDRQELARHSDGDELSVRYPVAKRQEQEDTECQGELIGARHNTDHRIAYLKAARDL